MGHDGIPAVDHPGVVPALVEHAQVAAQNAGEVHISIDSALIGADHHEAVLIEAQLRHFPKQGLEHLVGRHHIVEAHQRHRVHKPGIVSIKGNDVLYAHALQLLQSHSAVQALPSHPPVLTSAIKAGHDHRHPVGPTGHRLNQTLQICEMIVRRHMILHAKQIIGNAVIARIHHDENIVAPDGLLHQTLRVTALETGTGTFNDKRVLLNADFLGPSAKMNINEVRQLFRTRAGDQPKVCHLGIGVKKVGRRNHVI